MKPWIALFLLGPLSLPSYAGSVPRPPKRAERCVTHAEAPCPAISVSMINLLATPERYDGKVIQTTGFMAFELEHMALYFGPDSTADEGLWLNPDLGPFSNEAESKRYQAEFSYWQCMYNKERVSIRGTFSMVPDGHMFASFPGSLSKITKVELYGKEAKTCVR